MKSTILKKIPFVALLFFMFVFIRLDFRSLRSGLLSTKTTEADSIIISEPIIIRESRTASSGDNQEERSLHKALSSVNIIIDLVYKVTRRPM